MTATFSNQTATEESINRSNLSKFLASQFMFYGIEDEEIDYLNSISGEINQQSPSILAFKQRLLEKNINEAFLNFEIRNLIGKETVTIKETPVEVANQTKVKSDLDNLLEVETAKVQVKPIVKKKTSKWDEDEEDFDF